MMGLIYINSDCSKIGTQWTHRSQNSFLFKKRRLRALKWFCCLLRSQLLLTSKSNRVVIHRPHVLRIQYSMSCSIHLNFEMTKEANGLVVNVIHDATIFETQLFQPCERDRSNEYYMSINHHRPCDDHRQIHVPFIYHIRVVSDVRVLRLDRL